MLSKIVTLLIFIAGLINFTPVIGILSHQKLTQMYGLDFSDPALALLMRHRAALFGILGVFMLIAAFKPAWQMPAIVMGLLSMGSFLLLAIMIPNSAANLRHIALADIVGIVCLLIAALLILK